VIIPKDTEIPILMPFNKLLIIHSNGRKKQHLTLTFWRMVKIIRQ